ncbi:MAG: hypothetical protein A3H72_02690 [Candidatus Doudnabacteria bacterium RIFCSPLOWO2_02_FULL_48_8]|uniref:Uncharacterized protein n=1 Tax=Candidatus Doudnabacteria bacterium RIFCSPHIGHO2_01_FULL_46_24 TaxID=1817825 RepID=A0A1F5NV51_9BACT|nr:MAG: hypothetical protein A2720_03055 [Candidatus Doudnabacteria bacterium RIFCSPHIGHO2_01_FULL_46_24]OGE95084.1 MAG: hypothetical protein A3H72_02690 [Candidatus Doudnabacteria bacterium RIFCSPLOWO2_02_FULL_48_8]OGE95760.1 MAG: hypothetical protein A3E98_02825 [Candidatus Doudnabacteria bacterium RIFCSPHIGHO2_12_FULL_48_11]
MKTTTDDRGEPCVDRVGINYDREEHDRDRHRGGQPEGGFFRHEVAHLHPHTMGMWPVNEPVSD